MQRTRGIVTIIAFALVAFAISACGKPGTGGGTVTAPKNASPAGPPSPPVQSSAYTTVSGNGQPFSANLPVAVEPRAVDFGIVEPGSAHRQTFKVTNLGTTPLTLAAARTSCKCTTLTNLDGTVLQPGATLDMPTELVLTARPGEKTSYVQLVFNTASGQRAAKVDLRAVVELPVRAQPPYVDSLKGVTSGTLVIDSGDGQPFTILSSNGEAPQFADGFNPATDAPRSTYVLRWSTAGMACEGMRKWWVVETDRADCPILPCRIRHECSGSRDDPKPVRDARGWYFSEQIVNAGALPAGETATLELELVNTAQKPISGVMSLSPSATAKMISAEPSGAESTTVTFEFTPADDYDGMLYAMVNVLSPSGNKDVAIVAKVTR